MGVRNADGSVCYIIGVLKRIRSALNKKDGDIIHVVIREQRTGETEQLKAEYKAANFDKDKIHFER